MLNEKYSWKALQEDLDLNSERISIHILVADKIQSLCSNFDSKLEYDENNISEPILSQYGLLPLDFLDYGNILIKSKFSNSSQLESTFL